MGTQWLLRSPSPSGEKGPKKPTFRTARAQRTVGSGAPPEGTGDKLKGLTMTIRQRQHTQPTWRTIRPGITAVHAVLHATRRPSSQCLLKTASGLLHHLESYGGGGGGLQTKGCVLLRTARSLCVTVVHCPFECLCTNAYCRCNKLYAAFPPDLRTLLRAKHGIPMHLHKRECMQTHTC